MRTKYMIKKTNVYSYINFNDHENEMNKSNAIFITIFAKHKCIKAKLTLKMQRNALCIQ